jgi:hypothetical protein
MRGAPSNVIAVRATSAPPNDPATVTLCRYL